MNRANSNSTSQSQLQPGLHLNSDDLSNSADLTTLLHHLGDITDSEAADLLNLTEAIDQIIVYADDILVLHR
jgi:hypothetical protein